MSLGTKYVNVQLLKSYYINKMRQKKKFKNI